jgi:hypothetical protein
MELVARNVREWYAFYGGEEMGITLDQATVVWNAALTSIKEEKEILDDIIEKQLIIKFHDATCVNNHTDQCGWLYEIKNGEHQWQFPSHMSWFAKYIESKANNFEGCYEIIPYKE